MSRKLAYTLLFDLNLFLGITAVAGGIALLMAWIKLPLSSLAGSPFSDYTLPAVLLTAAVGGTALLAAWSVRARPSLCIPASAIAAGAIIIFEIVEWNVIGFAWLQAAYIGIGAAILGLATWVRMADVLLHVLGSVPPRATP